MCEALSDEIPGERGVRNGPLLRLVPDDLMPYDVMPDRAPDEEAVPFGEREPSGGPDWPPDVVPVVLWPVDLLRQALSGAPGAQLARVVADAVDVDAGLLADLPDDALGDLSVACRRMQSWAAGIQARVVAERASRESSPLAHASLVGQVTGELAVTQTEGSEVVVRAESGADHPTVIAALTRGRIDVKKAHTLLRSASQLTLAERAEAIGRFLPQAPTRTWRWLRARMLAFAKARHGSAETARAEAQRRCVQLDRAENDMGWVSAYLPAVDAAAVWGVVDDMAHQLRRTAGEDRDLGQLRADCLTGIVTGRLLPADRFTESDATGGTDPDGDPDGSADCGASSAGGIASDDADGPVCTCGGRAPVQEVTVRVTPTRPVVRVTVPATALLGLDDAPGELAGFGPIPADTARLIAQDATWQRLVTDPVTGVLVDHSTTTYKPGRVLRAAVEARDGTCMFLTCDTPAERCDLDHVEPFDHESTGTAQTRAQNLQPLCRRHHLLKTHAGWGVVRDPVTGVTTWTTPTGRNHIRPPTVLDTHVGIDHIDPDTSHRLTLRALTGQRPPRGHRTTERGTAPAGPTDPTDSGHHDQPPF
ncbi:HNH endonuclease signature motif containing protein [Promicromonospora soli]|uniref:HNH nuclease domain-containing protein n=1 Tax=Promicromonospora soli TaxID=2035533 RepID=A0A919FJ93_9MICO|nr:HNH endonuclease signature motif containing protein [Promicromonospora soli]GHH66863.1 hypothetical protein GCM10017772_07560 [Promicromonospora soli]